MDRYFLEFWGRSLLNAAKAQKQREELEEWIRQGFRGFEKLNNMFLEFYGFDRLNEESPDYIELRKKAEEEFRRSLHDFLRLFGVVSEQEHRALVERCNELEQRVAAQEETIKQLRSLLDEKNVSTVRGFEELLLEQSNQFNELVKSLAEYYKTDKN